MFECGAQVVYGMQKLLGSEISLVMDIEYNNVGQYVKEILEK